MIFGEERLFQTNLPENYQHELYLRFMGQDATGLKMRGIFPKLWKEKDNKVNGPELINEDGIYNIAAIDYNKGYLWVNQLQ